MKIWLKTVLLLVIASAWNGSADAAESLPATHAHGVHGMVLFGEPDHVFASHLPLYRHPHDWQVVLELRPATVDGQKMVNDLLAKGGLLTIEPERFDLWRLKPDATEPLTVFNAKLYRDHFERGGELLTELSWQVKKTWVFEPVRVATTAEPGERYYRIGDGGIGKVKKLWLLHKVERRPDTDQVVQVQYIGDGLPTVFQTTALLDSGCKDAQFKSVRVGWQDTDDLQ